MAMEGKPRSRGSSPKAPALQSDSNPSTQAPPSRDQLVRYRAFELFEQRLRREEPADPDADWYQAEREIDEMLAKRPGEKAAVKPPIGRK